MSCPNSNRRGFLRSSAMVVAAGAAVPYWFTGQDAKAVENTSKNDRPHIGAIGLGSRGTHDAAWAAKFGEIVAVCDVDQQHAANARAAFGGKAEVFEDYRKLLERKDIDIIINGTPDHWHTAINIAACKAGKDVYAEKPLTLTIDEGNILNKVVEETGRIVQVGTMQRSERQFQTAVELVRNGRIGKLKQVWVALPYFTTKGGPFPKQPVPSHLNWDMYQGQSPEHDYIPQRTHRVFRAWYEYSGGIITDWGNHHLDIAHWGMDCDLSGPTSVDARGLFPNPKGPEYYNTPDRFFSRLQYPNGVEVLCFTSMNERLRWVEFGDHENTSDQQSEWLFGKDAPDEIKTFERNGIMFIGENGRFLVNRGGIYGKPVEELKENPLPDDAWRVYTSDDHMATFFECVKTRRQPNATVQIEHRTVTACHLINLSIRLNRKLTWDPENQQIVGDDEARSMQSRPQRSGYEIAV